MDVIAPDENAAAIIFFRSCRSLPKIQSAEKQFAFSICLFAFLLQ
jgi:hypothetical protein